MRQEELARVAKVVGLSKLKTKYESHESKRQLCAAYDLFVADERVIPSLPKLLGACPTPPPLARWKLAPLSNEAGSASLWDISLSHSLPSVAARPRHSLVAFAGTESRVRHGCARPPTPWLRCAVPSKGPTLLSIP